MDLIPRRFPQQVESETMQDSGKLSPMHASAFFLSFHAQGPRAVTCYNFGLWRCVTPRWLHAVCRCEATIQGALGAVPVNQRFFQEKS